MQAAYCYEIKLASQNSDEIKLKNKIGSPSQILNFSYDITLESNIAALNLNHLIKKSDNSSKL